jgi:hypothetical protein
MAAGWICGRPDDFYREYEIQTDPYRFLICAEKIRTGYDGPLVPTLRSTTSSCSIS